MKTDKTKDQLYELLEKPIESAECEIADMALSRYHDQIMLRLFIYSDNGVSMEKCAKVSRLVGEIIDGTDLFKSGYTLEVSSPGLDRPLTTFRDFKYRVGEKVKIHFTDSKRKKLTAQIVAANDDVIDFMDGDDRFSLKLSEIEQAKIMF